MGSRKGAPNADLADVACYAVGRAFDVSNAEIARRMNRDDQTCKAWMVQYPGLIAKVEIWARRFVDEQRKVVEEIAAQNYKSKLETLLPKTLAAREDALDGTNVFLANKVAKEIEDRILGTPKATIAHEGSGEIRHTIEAPPEIAQLVAALHLRKGLKPPTIIDVTPQRQQIPDGGGA